MKNNERKWGQQNNKSKHFYFIGIKILKLSQGMKDKKYQFKKRIIPVFGVFGPRAILCFASPEEPMDLI